MLVREHFLETKKLLQDADSEDIASWLLNDGYFPEQYVLPPCFHVSGVKLKSVPYYPDFDDMKPSYVENVSYPKSSLTHRVFGVQHPKYYHDIVYWLMSDWDFIINHLFNDDAKIYSYSLPIPVTKNMDFNLSPLRSGRMIYEWIEMAERDLVVDAVDFKYMVRTDITNFYGSIYTHSIPWALHEKNTARRDKEYRLLGNKIDKLMQYSNDTKTNGIPIGSALSDLISEIILSAVDKNISARLADTEFVGVRFKDDYRVLCQSEKDASLIMKVISDELMHFNLSINESKTKVSKLPDGLYREHTKKYSSFSLSEKRSITFKEFENSALMAMDIHREYPGTSILGKFMSELFLDGCLKLTFSNDKEKRLKQLMKVVSILLLMKRDSEKIMSNVLSVIDYIFIEYRKEHPELKVFIKDKIIKDIQLSSEKDSVFDVLWLVFFGKFRQIGLGDTTGLIESDMIKKNSFYKVIRNGRGRVFTNSDVEVYRAPATLKDEMLFKYIDLFNRG